MLHILNKSKFIINPEKYGQYCFYIGTLLLATTNFFAGLFYLISLFFIFISKSSVVKKDNWNLTLLICTIIILLSSINVSISQNNISYYSVLRGLSWDLSSVWLNLFNWIPLFFHFVVFKGTLKRKFKD